MVSPPIAGAIAVALVYLRQTGGIICKQDTTGVYGWSIGSWPRAGEESGTAWGGLTRGGAGGEAYRPDSPVAGNVSRTLVPPCCSTVSVPPICSVKAHTSWKPSDSVARMSMPAG